MRANMFVLPITLAALACSGEQAASRAPAYGIRTAGHTPTNQSGAAPSDYSSKSSGTTSPTTTTSEASTITSTSATTRTEEQTSMPALGTWGSGARNEGTSATDRTGGSVTTNPGVADQTPSADNTKINDRERHGALTPGDQGNSTAETKITAAIRRGLMASKTLSFNAKNAKVITTGSKVTLRGTVKSVEEKAEIEAIAKSAQGVADVDNQLEVNK